MLHQCYSDDIPILGRDFEKAQAILYRMLEEKGLTINPKKVVPIDADTWFTFLGFRIRGEEITFSEDTIGRLKKNVRSLTKTRKGQPLKDESVLRRVIRQINRDLYIAYLQNDREFGWAEYMFSTVNVLDDIVMLDRYIKDHLRHVYTGRWNSRSNYNKIPKIKVDTWESTMMLVFFIGQAIRAAYNIRPYLQAILILSKIVL